MEKMAGLRNKIEKLTKFWYFRGLWTAFTGSNKIYANSNLLCFFFPTRGTTTAKQKGPKEAWADVVLDSRVAV